VSGTAGRSATLGSQGSPLGFVGSYEQAAETIDGFIQLGVQGFILSSTPALEEAFHVGEEFCRSCAATPIQNRNPLKSTP